MKVNREALLNQLESVKPGLSPKEVVEQSSCAIFKNGIITTFNDEIACLVPTDLDLEGAVPALPLISVLQKMSDEELSVTAKDNKLVISTGTRQVCLRLDKEVVLPMDSWEEPTDWKKLPTNFDEAIGMACQCVSTDATKYMLTCLHITPKFIESTDNYQVLRFTTKVPVSKPTLVKAAAIRNVVQFGMTEMAETRSWLHFKNPSGLVVSCRRSIDEYFKLDNHLKKEGEKVVLPKGLDEAVEKAEVFSSENPDENAVTVTLKSGKLVLKGEGISGWYRERKKVKYNGPEISFRIAPKLLASIAKQHNQCLLKPGKLLVDGGGFVYMTVLGILGD